jgi:RHS repeat-associated protein
MINGAGTFGGNQAQQNCTYTYNATGNLTNKCGAVLTYGDANHPSAVTNHSTLNKNYTYDANGNMITRGNQTLLWNIDNRLTSIGSTSMDYDYSGARVRKSTPNVTLYPFTGYEIDPNGTVTKYINVGGESLASKKKTNGGVVTQYFYHNDHLGSVNVVTDIAGNRVQLNEYDPWGAVSRSEGTIDPDKRFTGQKLDPETGLYYYGGRYYDAEIGRFVSADPFVQTTYDPQNLNRYSYVINNPQNYIDPDGYFHQVKKKKHGGIFSRLFGFFSIFIGIITLQPELAALAAASEVAVSITNIALAIGSIASGLSSVMTEGGNSGPPGISVVGQSSPAIFNNSGIMRISSGDFPEEEPWWKNVNWGGWCGFVCDVQAAGKDDVPSNSAIIQRAVRSKGGSVARIPKTPIRPGSVPQRAKDILAEIEKGKGAPPKGHVGGGTFENRPGPNGQLPPGNYKEYDINPRIPGQNRGTERLVIETGSGRSYYTPDHYDTFIPIK